MKERRLPHKAERVDAPNGKKVIDSIMVYPRSSGTLHVGEGSKEIPSQNFRIIISATVKDNVKCEKKLLGNADHYTAIVEVSNYNDSPAFVYLEPVNNSN